MWVAAGTLWSTHSQCCRMTAMLQPASDRSSGSQPSAPGTGPRSGLAAAALPLSAAMPCSHACVSTVPQGTHTQGTGLPQACAAATAEGARVGQVHI